MKLTLSSLSALALAAACGGGANPFQSNAPTYSNMALAQNDSDTTPPATASSPSSSTLALTAAPTDCHPHLFARTGEIIRDVNRHFFKHIRHVEDLIHQAHVVATGETRTWESVKDGIDRKLTMTATANADGSTTYSFELDVAAVASTPSFVKVMSGSITHIEGSSEERKGTVTFDFSALASVVTTERSTGQITDVFDNLHDPVKGEKRTATLTLTNFHFDDDAHGPRSGSYSFKREPGVGGKFQFTDSLVLLCPSNPSNLVADVTAVARWYKASDGAVHGRSDAKATGGQIAAGNAWLGVTCAKGQTTSAPAEGFWMMKLESSTGATVSAQADTTGSEPCDPVFGPVPSTTSNASDYDFSASVSFPNEW